MSPVASGSYNIFQQRDPIQLSKITKSAFNSLDYFTAALITGTLAVTSAGIWWALRKRSDTPLVNSTEYLILESSVTIEIGEGAVEIEYEDEDLEGRISLETILHSAPAQRLAFDIDKLPVLHIDRKPGNILERRGRKTLKLQPPDDGEVDMALVNINAGRLTVSPFSSKREPAKLLTDFPATRHRASKTRGPDGNLPSGVSTAPYMLQSSWRPSDSPTETK